jgi:IclR family KDG regulon transcriptional repressor
LSEETQFFAYLTVLDGGELISVAVERPESKAQFFVQLGTRIPVLSTAAARALLAYQDPGIVRPLVQRAVSIDPRTRVGTFTAESYLDELAETRRRGYAKCMEELEVGVSALGAPVLNARGRSVASLSIVAPTAALVDAWDTAVSRLCDVAGEASTMLGRRGEERATAW